MNSTDLKSLFSGIAKGSAATCAAALLALLLLSLMTKATK